MNLYLAAVYTNNYMSGQKLHEDLNEHERQITHNIPNILESWHYVGKQRYVDDMRRNNAKIFLDSGAFSAYTLGVKLSIKEYVDYIIRNKDILRVEDDVIMASVLDGIGDPLATYRNQLEMEARGFRPMPCFHAGEDERYLEYYVSNYSYITLGGMVGSSSKALMVWLDRMWERYLTDGAGRPRTKVHGFGITSMPIMEAYPWHSVDSSSWIQATSFGSIIVPGISKKSPAFTLNVSEKSPSRHVEGQHAINLTPQEMDYVFQLLEQQGFTYERLSTVYQSRAAYNMWAYGVLNSLINASKSERFKTRVRELF